MLHHDNDFERLALFPLQLQCRPILFRHESIFPTGCHSSAKSP